MLITVDIPDELANSVFHDVSADSINQYLIDILSERHVNKAKVSQLQFPL